tara:strand:+ start:9216 stop:9827 length:612 start_codon:yes stop_codon:yes gene_type:complete
MKLLRSLICLFLLLPALTFAAQFTAGKDYKVISGSAPAGVTVTDKTVMEFFNPGCPACFAADDAVEAWLKTQPKSVTFVRVPLVYHQQWEIYAKAYYVAEAYGVENKFTPEVFNMLHKQGKTLQKESDYYPIFAKLGVNEQKVKNAFASSSLNIKLQQGQALMQAYRVFQIPSFVVGGKYYTNPSLAGSPERMMQIVDFLLKK